MIQAKERSELKRACGATALMLAIIFMGGGSRLRAQTPAVPGNMPILYKEIPDYALARERARYRIKLSQCIIEYRGDGYYVTTGDQEFVILNQNPACLKRFAGKMVALTTARRNDAAFQFTYTFTPHSLTMFKFQAETDNSIDKERPVDVEAPRQ